MNLHVCRGDVGTFNGSLTISSMSKASEMEDGDHQQWDESIWQKSLVKRWQVKTAELTAELAKLGW